MMIVVTKGKANVNSLTMLFTLKVGSVVIVKVFIVNTHSYVNECSNTIK